MAHATTTAPPVRRRSFGELLSSDFRALPIVIGLVALWMFFASQSDVFLTPRNLSNLLVQSTVVGIMALGLMFVLLVKEIDLSIAAINGVTSVLMAKLIVEYGFSPWIAVPIAILIGAGIGSLSARWVTYVGVPSFVVTLGLGLALNGLQLILLPETARYGLNGTGLERIALTNIAGLWAWVVLAHRHRRLRRPGAFGRRRPEQGGARNPVPAGRGAADRCGRRLRHRRRGDPDRPPGHSPRGADLRDPARHRRLHPQGDPVRAVPVRGRQQRRGGAAGRRQGAADQDGSLRHRRRHRGARRRHRRLPHPRGRASSPAAASAAARCCSSSIAAAVIGGVSLFGGRGAIHAALLGALVIGTVQNGLNLMGVENEVRLIVTGLLLVLAVSIDKLIEKATGQQSF